MAKLVLSANEFELITEYFKAPKEGAHIKWREFCDSVDTIFNKKGLEKNIDMPLNDVRTQTKYGKINPSKVERNLAEDLVARVKSLLLRERLNAKSFFQDFDRHRHFKVSPKQFRQVLANFGIQMTDEDLQSVIKTYGNELNDI